MPTMLTPYQKKVQFLALSGAKYRVIANAVGSTPGGIRGTCAAIRRKGHYLPCRYTASRTPEELTLARSEKVLRMAAAEEKRVRAGLDPIAPVNGPKPLRPFAEGARADTGERISVSADTQAFADAHLAAMLA